MTDSGARRVATARGAILGDARCFDGLQDEDWEAAFDPRFWAARGKLGAVQGGRGAAWFVAHGDQQWVLRHYRRGGFAARLSADRYLWAGETRVRAFAEYRVLAALAARSLPVPAPVGARYERLGLWYRCDLITQRIADARPLSALLAEAPLADASWIAVGAAIARLHAAGADHADLNAHNILLDARGAVRVVDFDRGRIRAAGPWTSRNLRRLHRSLAKIARELPADRFALDAWQSLLAGYAATVPDSRRIASGG